MCEEEHEEGADAVDGAGVGVVEAVGALVVLVRYHLTLRDREGAVSPGAGGGQGEEEEGKGRRRVGGAYGAASLLGADGEEEGEDVEEDEEAAEREGGQTRGGEPGRGRRGDGEGGLSYRGKLTNGAPPVGASLEIFF